MINTSRDCNSTMAASDSYKVLIFCLYYSVLLTIGSKQYMSGFGNEFSSEALPNALPKGQVR